MPDLTHEALTRWIESSYPEEVTSTVAAWRDGDQVWLGTHDVVIARIGQKFIEFPVCLNLKHEVGRILSRVVTDNGLGTNAGLVEGRWMVNLGDGKLAPLGGYTFEVGIRSAGERTPEPVGGQS
jgi:hypothetical protein